MTVRRAVQARPNRSPARNWRGSTRSGPAPRRLAAGPVGGRRASARRRRARPGGSGSAPTARPMARNVSPTATMCAWYQVVAIWAVYQKTVPKAKKTVVAEPDDQADRQPPDRPPADRDVDRGEDREDHLVVGREAPHRDERQQDERPAAAGTAAGRAATPSVVGDRQDVLEEGVAEQAAGRLDRVADRRPGPRGRRPPARRSGRSSGRRR